MTQKHCYSFPAHFVRTSKGCYGSFGRCYKKTAVVAAYPDSLAFSRYFDYFQEIERFVILRFGHKLSYDISEWVPSCILKLLIYCFLYCAFNSYCNGSCHLTGIICKQNTYTTFLLVLFDSSRKLIFLLVWTQTVYPRNFSMHSCFQNYILQRLSGPCQLFILFLIAIWILRIFTFHHHYHIIVSDIFRI